MKTFFVLLLLANILAAFYLHNGLDEDHSAQISLIHPEKIELLPAKVACLKWGELVDPVAQHVRAEISKWGSEQNRVVEISGGEVSVHWVHIPSLRDKRGMTRQIEQLDKLGIPHWHVQENTDHPWHNMISLAIFMSGADATMLVDKLKSKGLEQVTENEQIMERYEFEIRNPTDQITGSIQQLANQFPETKLEVTECDRL